MYIKELLLEAVYGNMAIVYHRTNAENIIHKIYDEGFKTGDGIMYGRGFYATYNLESQLNERMKQTYGDYIIKFAIPLDNFLILDYPEFKKSPISKKFNSTKETYINDQLKFFNIDNNVNYTNTSDIILKYYNYLQYKANGVIFTGTNDGKILVCYNLSIIRPLSLSLDEGKTFIPYTEKLRQYIKKQYNIISNNINQDIKNLILRKNNIDNGGIFKKYLKTHTFDDLLQIFQNEIIEYDSNNNFNDIVTLLLELLDRYLNIKSSLILPNIYYDIISKYITHDKLINYFFFMIRKYGQNVIIDPIKIKKIIDNTLKISMNIDNNVDEYEAGGLYNYNFINNTYSIINDLIICYNELNDQKYFSNLPSFKIYLNAYIHIYGNNSDIYKQYKNFLNQK